MTTALHEVGYVLTSTSPDYVVLAETRTYSFSSITTAIRLIQGGARFVATNPDPTGPSTDGDLPATDAPAHRIPNGYDTTRFAPDPEAGRAFRASLGIAPDALVVVTPGKLARNKGHDVAFEALRRLGVRGRGPSVYVVLGDGIREDELRGLAGGLPMSTIFTGFMPPDRVAAALNAADLVVHPSSNEIFPNAVGEAMACGCAIVATDAGGTRSCSARMDWRGCWSGRTIQPQWPRRSPSCSRTRRAAHARGRRAAARRTRVSSPANGRWLRTGVQGARASPFAMNPPGLPRAAPMDDVRWFASNPYTALSSPSSGGWGSPSPRRAPARRASRWRCPASGRRRPGRGRGRRARGCWSTSGICLPRGRAPVVTIPSGGPAAAGFGSRARGAAMAAAAGTTAGSATSRAGPTPYGFRAR